MSSLRIYLLGSPTIEYDGLPIKVDTRKAIALLAFLAITRERHSRDVLIDLLWPEYDARRGHTNLRRTLYALRKALSGEWITADREFVRINPEAEIWLDVDQFHNFLSQCQTHGHLVTQACQTCLGALVDAVRLYRGDFLKGFSLKDSLNFDEWQLLQTGNLRSEFASALQGLVEGYSAQGAFDTALHFARRWLALDLLNEAAHRHLMQLYHWSGQRSAVIRQYQSCVEILNEELGVSPQASTAALFQAIEGGHGPPSPVIPGQRQNGIGGLKKSDRKLPSIAQPDLKGDEVTEPTRGIFVARQRELNQMVQALDEALAGRGRPIFVIGSAGQGKTALIQEFAHQAQERQPDLIYAAGNCNAYTGLGDPYLPFREMLNLLTGDVDALWTAQAISRENARRLWDAFPIVMKVLVDMSPDLVDTFVSGLALERRAAAYIAEGLSQEVEWLSRLKKVVAFKSEALHEFNLQQSALFEQYTQVIVSLAREKPLLLALDDLQWADAGSISLLFHLGRRMAEHRILIVGAFRPEDLVSDRAGERHPLEAIFNEFQRTYGDITVDLALAENQLFVDEYLDSEPNRLNTGFREVLYRQTSGHPLFTVELLRGIIERGDLVQDKDGYWIEGKAFDWEILPTRVEAVIAERVSRLAPASQEVLRVASVEGEAFTAEVIADVLPNKEHEVIELLNNQLDRRHRIVRAQEIQRLGAWRVSRYRFRHILFQNYLYHTLNAVERAYLHERVGTALEKLYGEENQEIALSLARHFQEAGLAEKAITYLYLAGEKAKRSSANESAIAHYASGLALINNQPHTPERDQLELKYLIAMGVPLVLTKGHSAPEVKEIYSRARSLCEGVGDNAQLFQVLLGLRRFYLHKGELEEASNLGKQLYALSVKMGDASCLSRACMMQAEISYRLGDFAQTLLSSQQGLASYDPQQSLSHILLYGNDTGIGCHIFESLAEWHLGYPDRALRTSQDTIERARRLSHPFTLVFSLYFTAHLYQLCRDISAVQMYCEELLTISKELGFSLYQVWGKILSGWVLVQQNEVEVGITQMRQGITVWQEMGARLLIPNFLFFIAEAYYQTGDIDQGLRTVEEALTKMQNTGERTFEPELYRLKGELLLAKGGDVASVDLNFQRALKLARDQNARSWELRAATSLGRLWPKEGKPDQASKLLEGVYRWFTEGFDTPDLQDARTLLDALKRADQ